MTSAPFNATISSTPLLQEAARRGNPPVVAQTTSAEFATVAAALSGSTVQVHSQRAGGGSGVIWHPDGLIVTNAHVATSSQVTVELADGRVFEAVRTSFDPRQDLATLKIEATDLPAAPKGDSDVLRVGELVLAVGFPGGRVGALTAGIISCVTPSSPQWVMADIRLAPGNSGGPLADARGRVIGINTMIAGGLALAVPSNKVERFLKGNKRPLLGVTLQPVLVSLDNRRLLGLLVLSVEQESLAMASGLQIGDVLIGANGQHFTAPSDPIDILDRTKPGEPLSIEFLRSGERRHCTVNLGSRDGADTILASSDRVANDGNTQE